MKAQQPTLKSEELEPQEPASVQHCPGLPQSFPSLSLFLPVPPTPQKHTIRSSRYHSSPATTSFTPASHLLPCPHSAPQTFDEFTLLLRAVPEAFLLTEGAGCSLDPAVCVWVHLDLLHLPRACAGEHPGAVGCPAERTLRRGTARGQWRVLSFV